MNTRKFRARLPLGAVVTAIAIGSFVLGGIVTSIWYTSEQIREAKKTGMIVGKDFTPGRQHEVSLSSSGQLQERDVPGIFRITVEVPQSDHSKKSYIVWIPDEKSYEQLNIGDSFDVGPYLVRSDE